MAELDDKLLKNLDKTLQSMNQRLQGLEQTLAGVKEGMVSAFNPAIIKSFTDSMRGLKAIRLIEADEAVKDIKKIKDEIDSLESKYKGEKPLKKGESLGSVREELSRYKALMREIDKGSEQRAIELANIRQKERDADLKAAEVVVSQREQAERRKAEIARAWAEQEAREKAQREKMKTASEKAAADERTAIAEAEAKKKSEIAKAWAERDRKRYEKDGDPLGEIAARKRLTGTLAALQDTKAIYEYQKQENEALAEYIRLYKEKDSLVAKIQPLEAQKSYGAERLPIEDKLLDDYKNRLTSVLDRMNELLTTYRSVKGYQKELVESGKEELAQTEQKLANQKAIGKEAEKLHKRNLAEEKAEQKRIEKEAIDNLRQQKQIKSEIAKIDHDRQIRRKSDTQIEASQAAAEKKRYSELQAQLSALIAKQKELNKLSPGITAFAQGKVSGLERSLQSKEAQRYAQALREVENQWRRIGVQQENSNKKLQKHKSTLDSMLPTLQRLSSAFGIAFSVRSLAQLGKKLIETRGEFEMQFVAMKQIIGDVDAATKIWNQTMQQALQSPFKAMQLVDYTKKLAAYRVETEKLFDTTKRLADVSAGLGVDMGRLILAYGQVKTANYLRASEVRQFTEAGVNIYGELAKYFSEIEGHAVSTAEVVERVTKRMVLFSDVEAIFKRMTDEGGVFFNMQEVQADTVKGQIQKLHDAYDQMLNTIGQSNQGTIRDLVDSLNNLVRHWRDVQDFLMRNVRTMLILLPLIKSYQKGASLAADKAYTWGMFTNRLRYSMEGFGAGLKGTTGAMMRHRLSLMAGTTAMRLFHGAVEITKNALRTFVPFLALEGLMLLATKMSEARRAAEELTKSIDEIKGRNTQSLQENIEGFNKLKTAIEQTNDGSLERQRLVEKMNNTYGDYLPNLITEVDTVKQLDDAYDGVIQNMREYAYQKTKEEVGERLRTSMFDEYTEAVKNLTKGLGSTINYGAEGARAFKLNKSEIQDILKMIQDEVMKNPDFTDVYATNIANQVIRNYTGLNDAVVSNEKYWRQYVIEIRDQVKELQDLDEYARDVVGGTYSNVEERRAAESLREKAEKELEAENEAWAKEKESLRTTIEESVLKGIMEARDKASKVTRQEGESDEDFARRAWDAQVKADEEAQNQIRQQHTITNFAIEQKEKEHQAKLLKIRLDNQQISAREYNKQMLSIYPELDDRIKQYNDKIRDMVVGKFGEDWGGNADAIALFKQMRIGIDDVSQGVAQYQKNFAGTVENQKKIVLDLLSWRDRGYEIDEKDLQVQREKLAVYYEMAHLLGVEVRDKVIGDALFENIQGIWGQSFSGFKMPETDKLMSQMELLDKYTKKWKEYDQEYLNLIRSLEDLQESGASEETIQILQKQIEEAKTNSEAYKALIDLLGSSEKSRQPISETIYNEVKSKLGESFGFFKLEETDKLMSQMELLDKYTKKWKDYEETLKSLTKSMEEMKKQNASQDAIDALQLQIDEAQANTEASKFLIDLLGYIAKAIGGGRHENASKLISLIKEMRSEYDKLSKSAYGYAKSEEKVRESYKDSVKEILGKAGITDYDFTTNEGMIKALEKVKSYATKLGKDAAAEVQKYIDQLETEIEINAQVRIREDFGKQMEKAFGDYELTLDIEKLNLPSDVLADMFDIESVDLAGLRKKIEEGYERLRGENGGNVDETDRKNIEGYIKKIDEMERKQQRERIKDYAKYLEYEMSERAKITMEYVRKISDVQAETSFSSKQKDRIVKGLTKEMNEKLAKQDWDDFKGSEVYVQMMEDLEKHGSAALVTMRKELEKIRDNAENLSPRALKEVVNALAKIKEIELNRSNPFTALNQSRVDMQNAISKANAKSREEVYAEADAIEKEIVAEQGRKREIDNIVSARKEGLRIEEELSKLYSRNNILDYAVTHTDKDDFVQSNINALQAAIKANVSEIENLQTERAKEGTTEERVRQIDDEIGSIIEETNQYREQKEILEKILQLRISLGLIDKNAIQDEDAERRQAESETKLENLAEEQRRYQEAVDAIDRYNAQVQRAMQFVDEWAGKVQGLWGEISNLSTAYEGEFGDWVAKWGNVIDVSLSQVSKLSKAFADFRKTRADYLKSAVKKTTDKVSNAAETAQTATATLATNAETEAITANTLAKTENAVASNLAATGNTAVGTTATAATPAVATFGATLLMAMGWVGLIIAALEALFVIIKAIAGANDEGIDQKIEDSKDKVDKLTKAYERLEKQIEKTWDTVSYMREYNEEVQNLQQQIEEANNQIAAAQGYKNEDKKKEAIEAAEDAKQEALDALDEIKQKQIEVFGGIGKEGYRDAAQGFVDAWKSAFLETGDGLQGLQDHFDEFLQDWFTKQLTMKYAAAALKPLFAMMDAAVDQYGPGGVEVIQQELDEMREWAKVYFPQIADELEKNASIWGLEGEGGLSGLAAGIQGMTEEQANVLEGYWNTVMGNTININNNVADILGLLRNGAGGVGGGEGKGNIFGDPNVETNPMLKQLDLIAVNTAATHRILESVTKSGHSQGGYGIKVFAD